MKVIRLKFVHFRSLLPTVSLPPRRVALSPQCGFPPCRRQNRRGRSDQQESAGRKATRARTLKTKVRTLGPASPMQRSPKKSGQRSWRIWRQLAHRPVRRRPEIPSLHQNLRRRPKRPSLLRHLRRHQRGLSQNGFALCRAMCSPAPFSAATRPGVRRHLHSHKLHQVLGLRLPLRPSSPCRSRVVQRPLLRRRCL
jgi:hypothetical protein